MRLTSPRPSEGGRIRPAARAADSAPQRTAPADKPSAAPDIDAHLANLETQLQSLKAQVRQAQQLAGLGTAAATIAHEVNNLLTPLLSYSRLALDTNDPILSRKALEVTLKNVHTLVQMSERVLGISAARVRACAPIVIADVAREAAEALCRDLSKDGIRFTVEARGDAVAIADALQIRQVLFNLFLNARQALKGTHSGRLSVTAAREGSEVHIKVTDNGPGMAPDLLTRIFEPLQSTKGDAPGGATRCSGLGLTLSRELVMENGGTLSVESSVGQGTTFHIILPAADIPASPAN